MSRTSRAILTYLSSFFRFIGTTLIAFFTSPIILDFLGKEAFGAFRAASDWVGYLALLEFGLSGALIPILARSLANNNSEELSLTIAIAIRAYVVLSLLMLLFGCCLVLIIPNLIHVSPFLKNNLQWGIVINLLGLLLFPLTIYQVLSQVSQAGYISNLLLFVQALSTTSLSILFAWMGLSIAGQFLAVLLGSIPYHLGLTIYFMRLYPNIHHLLFKNYKILKHSIASDLWNLNWPCFLINVCGRLSLMTDNIIIASILGPSVVVLFFLTQRLPSLALSQIQTISASSWPGLIDMYNKGQIELFSLRLIELTKLIVILGVAVLISITAYNFHFVTLWVGISNFAGELVTIFSAINNLMLAIFSLWTYLLIGIGNVSLLTPIVVCSTIINFLLSLFCTIKLGIVGPLVGTFIGFTTTYLWWIPWLFQRNFGIPIWSLLKSIGKPFLVGIPYGLIVWYAARNHTPWGWLGLAAEMAVSAILYLVVAWLLVLERSERKAWNGRLRMLFAMIHFKFSYK